MPLLTGIVRVEDSNGERIDVANADGTHAPIVLKLDSTLRGTPELDGSLVKITLSAPGAGGGGVVSFSNHAAFRATSSASLSDGQVVHFQSPLGDWVYFTSTGAGEADDDRTIIKPTDISLGSNGRLYSLDSPTLPNITALRLAVSGKQSTIHVQGYAAISDGGGGIFDFDASDTTSADNGGTIIVAGTRRYKRRFAGNIHAHWFGASPSVADNGPPITAAIAATGVHRIGVVELGPYVYPVTTTITISGDFFTALRLQGAQGRNSGLLGTILRWDGADSAASVVHVFGGFNLMFQNIDINCTGKALSGWLAEGNVGGAMGLSGVRWAYCHVANMKRTTAVDTAGWILGDGTGFQCDGMYWTHCTVAGTDVQAYTATDSGDLITSTNHGLLNGDIVRFQTDNTAGGLTAITTYFVKNKTTHTFQVALTPGGSTVPITSDGSGSFQFNSGNGWLIRGGANTKEAVWVDCGAGRVANGMNWGTPSGKQVWFGGGFGTTEACFVYGEGNLDVCGCDFDHCYGMILKGINTGGRAGSVAFRCLQANVNLEYDRDIAMADVMMFYNAGYLDVSGSGFLNLRGDGSHPPKVLLLSGVYEYATPGNYGFGSRGCSYANAPGPYIPVIDETQTYILTHAILSATPAPVWSRGDLIGVPPGGLLKALPLAGRPDVLPSLANGIVHVSSGELTGSAIVNADVATSAAIAGTKISPDFGSQNIVTTGNITTTTGFVGVGSGTRASAGYVRSDNAFTIGVRGAGAYDLSFVSQFGDTFTFGDATHVAGFDIQGTTLHQIYIGSTPVVQIVSAGLALNAAQFVFGASVTSPFIFQANVANGTGQKLSIAAQAATIGTGGALDVGPGNGTVAGGLGRLVTGALQPKFNWDDTGIGFYGVSTVARPSAYTQTYSTADKTLGAYTPDSESGAYTGIDNAQAGAVYATVADLNALRVAYENLRAFVEDAVQMLNASIDDDQAQGLKQ